MRLEDLLDRPRLVALVPDEQPVCGVFLETGELVVAWDRWVHVLPDPRGDESVDWNADEHVVTIQRAHRSGAALCRLQSGKVVELCVERGVAMASRLDHAPVSERDEPPALPPIDGPVWVTLIASTDDAHTVLLLSDGELIVADLRPTLIG